MILIINKSLRNAILVADLFHYMGMLAYPATYEVAPSEVRSEYRTFLLYEPTESASELVDAIRKVCTASLIIEIRKGAAADPYPRTRCGADAVLDSDMTAAAIAAKLDKIRGSTQKGRLSEYGTADLITDFGDSSVIFGGKRIRLTKTELMIVKFQD